MIDQLLERVLTRTPGTNGRGANGLPKKPDIEALARSKSIPISRGSGSAAGGINIPAFYSEREARVAIARVLAEVAVQKIAAQCIHHADDPDCPSPGVCELAKTAKSDPSAIDEIAAAMLIPTADFNEWADLLEWKQGKLADARLANSFAVPIELARLRREALSFLDETSE
jgi:hypothetical protein